jgi:hypothetical protein
MRPVVSSVGLIPSFAAPSSDPVNFHVHVLYHVVHDGCLLLVKVVVGCNLHKLRFYTPCAEFCLCHAEGHTERVAGKVKYGIVCTNIELIREHLRPISKSAYQF